MTHTEERKTAWTRGPWAIEEETEDGDRLYIRDDSLATIAILIGDLAEDGEPLVGDKEWANAHLIAAAPLLREVAELAYAYTERIRLFLDAPERGGYELERFAHELQDKACAALAAARGEAS